MREGGGRTKAAVGERLAPLLALTPRQFEFEVSRYLSKRGFNNIEVTGRSGDLGVDIQCQDEQGRFVVVQCKRYRPDRNIGSPDIQTFYGMVVHHGASRGIFVTTSSFTKHAQDLARKRDLELISGSQIADYCHAQQQGLREEAVRLRHADVRRRQAAAQQRSQRKQRLKQIRDHDPWFEQQQEYRRQDEHRRENVPGNGALWWVAVTFIVAAVMSFLPSLAVWIVWGETAAQISTVIMFILLIVTKQGQAAIQSVTTIIAMTVENLND